MWEQRNVVMISPIMKPSMQITQSRFNRETSDMALLSQQRDCRSYYIETFSLLESCEGQDTQTRTRTHTWIHWLFQFSFCFWWKNWLFSLHFLDVRFSFFSLSCFHMLRDSCTIGVSHDESSNISIDSSTMLLPTGRPVDKFFLCFSLKTWNVSHALLL